MTSPFRAPNTDPTNIGNPPGGNGPLRAGGTGMPAGGMTNDENLPSTPSAAAKRQMPALKIVRDLFAGNERIKEEGETYLPKGGGEDQVNYRTRLARACLYNAFRHTVTGLVGFVFRDPPKLGEDVPTKISVPNDGKVTGLWENIDNAGTHGDVFARDIMSDAMVAGHAAILVEYPNTGGKQTLRDERTGTVRPYWVPIRKDNILSWRASSESGKTTLLQVVLRESVVVPKGMFGESVEDRFRVLYNENGTVGWRLFRITDQKALVLEIEGLYPTQDEIPLAEVVTSGREGIFESVPPLLDLAYMNLAHYRQWSDYDTSIRMTCVPLLFTAGFQMTDEQGEPIVIGPNSALRANDPAAKAEYVTHDGGALGEVKASLDDLENRMGQLGLAALASSKRTAETAKAKEIDKGATDSALAVMARGLEDGLERALYFTAKYLKEPSGGSIEINTNFADLTMDAATMTAWGSLAQALPLPARVVIEALISGGRLPEETDVEALAMEIEAASTAEADRKAEEFQRSLEATANDPRDKAE